VSFGTHTLDIFKEVNELPSVGVLTLHIVALFHQRNLDISVRDLDSCV
jgi:hypothetical protein